MTPILTRRETFQSLITDKIDGKSIILEIFQANSKILLDIKGNSNLMQSISLLSPVHIEED